MPAILLNLPMILLIRSIQKVAAEIFAIHHSTWITIHGHLLPKITTGDMMIHSMPSIEIWFNFVVTETE
ncbi:hypothetical protein SDJN02_00701, partial [Cucurbita argyrosperma subsp. argyrosperma]